ncbi:MAG: enoyl-CoA hydratase/isomerase family protein [Burkholderiales bacterium]|nr:enoyl-CoA hydratase/isomerase family protein [Burkholderiales bacterium]
MTDLLRTYERGVLRVTLNRPERRNTLTRATLRELRIVFEAHAAQEDLRLAILTGAGPVAFCAGADLADLSAVETAEAAEAYARDGMAALDALRAFPVPTIAALNGVTLAEGAELALACDMRVAAHDARIGFVHASDHRLPGLGGATDLARLVGPGPAMELLATARRLAPAEAHALGLVNAVAAPDHDFLEEVERLAAPVREHHPHVLRSLKALALGERFGAGVAERREREIAGFVAAWTHPLHQALLGQLRAELE